jgi:hypothetical protein
LKSTCIPHSLYPGGGAIGGEFNVIDDDKWPIRDRQEWLISWVKSFDEHCIAIWWMDFDKCWSIDIDGFVSSSWSIFNNCFFSLVVDCCWWGIIDEWLLKEFWIKKLKNWFVVYLMVSLYIFLSVLSVEWDIITRTQK